MSTTSKYEVAIKFTTTSITILTSCQILKPPVVAAQIRAPRATSLEQLMFLWTCDWGLSLTELRRRAAPYRSFLLLIAARDARRTGCIRPRRRHHIFSVAQWYMQTKVEAIKRSFGTLHCDSAIRVNKFVSATPEKSANKIHFLSYRNLCFRHVFHV